MADVLILVQTGSKAGRYNERYCNGDRHPRSENPEDKAENARHWKADVARAANDILTVAQPYGFTGVEFTGLYPTLKRGNQYVEIPY